MSRCFAVGIKLWNVQWARWSNIDVAQAAEVLSHAPRVEIYKVQKKTIFQDLNLVTLPRLL